MPFQHVPVLTVGEALSAMRQYGEGGKIYAGGVALSILMKSRVYKPEALIDIAGVKELSFIEPTPAGGLRIGAGTVHRAIETSPLVRERFPLLAEVFHNVATIRIRNQGTIGGNICFAEPASDPPGALLALEARMKARGVDGTERVIPAQGFWTGYYECALRPDELLTGIEIGPLPDGFRTGYTRFTTRSKEDKPCVSVSAAVAAEADGVTCREARIGLGGVEPVFRRLTAVEEGLRGKALTREAIDGVLSGALDDLDPISDIRASGDYRRQVTPVLIRRTIEKAMGRA
ncbi:MAG: xanthine dehydrogenase family protein subunit M [Nitrospinota bacterium]